MFHDKLHNILICFAVILRLDRAIPQAVSRRLPTAAGGPGSNPGLVMWNFVMDKSCAGAGFLSENFGFPCQSTFHLLLHSHLHCHPRLAQ
jgi:hypothetical protein